MEVKSGCEEWPRYVRLLQDKAGLLCGRHCCVLMLQSENKSKSMQSASLSEREAMSNNSTSRGAVEFSIDEARQKERN